LRDANCAFVVFDITSTLINSIVFFYLISVNFEGRESFESVDSWIKDYRDCRGSDAPCAIVANKMDLIASTVMI